MRRYRASSERNHTPAFPFCHLRLRAPKSLPPAYPRELRTSGDHLRKRRLDLGLLQREVAKEIGVSKETLTSWELNRRAPAVWNLPGVIGFLGYLAFGPGQSLRERLRAYQKINGLSQRSLAQILGVDESSVYYWEQGRRQPRGELLRRVEALLARSLDSES